MSAATIAALATLVTSIATLVAALAAVYKAMEAKDTAQSVSAKADVNHAETVDKLDTVVKQTNGILTASQQAVADSAIQIAAVVNDVEALKKGHNP